MQYRDILPEHLRVEDLLRLCRTSKEYSKWCKDPLVWRRLLRRDFGIDAKHNPQLEYCEQKYNQLRNKKIYQVYDSSSVNNPPIYTFLADNVDQVYQYLADEYNDDLSDSPIAGYVEYVSSKYNLPVTAQDIKSLFKMFEDLYIRVEQYTVL